MCYGSLDPKYAMREAEGRLAGLPVRVSTDEKAAVARTGVLQRLWTDLSRRRIFRKAAAQ